MKKRLALMGLKFVSVYLQYAMTRMSPAVRQMLFSSINELDDRAQHTVNNWDNEVIYYLKVAFGIK